jgi:S1/P1 Nuclease
MFCRKSSKPRTVEMVKARFMFRIALLLVALLSTPSLAWNALGHKVVAEIAWRQLSPDQRQAIVDTLRRHPRFDADFAGKMTDDVLAADKATQDRWIFQHAAYWPDIARGLPAVEREKYNRPTWHYVTNPLFLDSSDRDVLASRLQINNSAKYPTDAPKDEYNVLQAIKHCQAALRSRAGPEANAVAYCWLFHLVGDIHQPLHSTSLYSVKQFPDGDRGGNSIPLAGGENLHSRWDGLLGRRDLLRNVDMEVAELSDRQYRDVWRLAAKVTDPRKWADESHDLCKSVVYSDAILNSVRHTPAGAKMMPMKLPTAYMQQAGDVARRRVITAGVRLGTLLGEGPSDDVADPPAASSSSVPVNSLTPNQQAPPLSSVRTHWLNTGSNVRHNQSCKWFGQTKHGRYCAANEGKPCGECGG